MNMEIIFCPSLVSCGLRSAGSQSKAAAPATAYSPGLRSITTNAGVLQVTHHQ
jgi:hypothetical protein